MVGTSPKIRRLMTDAGFVTAEEWDTASKGKENVLELLLSSGKFTERQFFETVGPAAGVVPVFLVRVKLEQNAVEAIQRELCEQLLVLPIVLNGDVLTVAVSDPFDVLRLDDLKQISGCKVRTVLSHPSAVRQALIAYYDKDNKQIEGVLGTGDTSDLEAVRPDDDDVRELSSEVATGSEDAPAVKVVNSVLLRALREKASDIHIEPGDKDIRIRFRVDGRMAEQGRVPRTMGPAISSRLKILASLDIAERQIPQDGKFQIKHENRRIDFRLSTLPVVGGEKCVMRILDQGGAAKKLDDLKYEPKCLADIRAGTESAYGMVLVTGPTGSGKSTTLYACVQEVASPEINVVTVEDPVEYRMDGINQVPVNPKRGLTFAGALRSILRQDPDVVLLGEIRDKETAEIAVKAALTGHLVLSTLHTNDAPQAITRLIDMGIDPFMVSSSVVVVCAQRLVRRLCEHCRVPLELPEKELLNVGFKASELQGLKLHGPHPPGCPRCKNGYKGRLALLETMLLDATIKRMIVEGRAVAEIKGAALAAGMLTLRRVGILNVIRGHTSLEEVLRVTVSD
ncbi:MAG: type II secretion system protein GspE [Planctomycetes bacterium]|nr:type II secretion system protein GspE [Planctomycetota bacterium]